MSDKIITANRLSDGRVIYLANSGNWTEELAEAARAADPGAEARLLAVAEDESQRWIAISPYVIDVGDSADTTRPKRFREWIRAFGPTIRTPVGPQPDQQV